MKSKQQSASKSEKDYDRIYESRKDTRPSGGSLADQVAAAAKAVKTKKQSSPMSEEDYDKLYDPRKVNDSKDRTLETEVALAALAVKLNNKASPMTEEDYDKLYTPIKHRRDTKDTDDKILQQYTEKPQHMYNLTTIEKEKSPPTSEYMQDYFEDNTSQEDLDIISVPSSYTSADPSDYKSKESVSISHQSQSSSDSTSTKTSLSRRKLCCKPYVCYFIILMIVIVASAIGAPFVVREKKDGSENPNIPNLETPTGPPTQSFIDIDPTTPPTNKIPVTPTVVDTQKPTLEKVPSSPPKSPEDGRSAFLRQLLVLRWPPLGESLNIPSSPQSQAFQWLVGLGSEVDNYSDQQLSQRFAMATLFFSTNGEKWFNKEGWLSSESECQWYQTKDYRDHCDASGNLVNLELNGNNLSGTLPSELAMLSSSLTRLDLAKSPNGDGGANSVLFGIIPIEIGLLTSLQYISMSYQQMAGTIPSEIGKLSFLAVLDLAGNKFAGSLPTDIGELQKLNNIYLGFNNLSGAIPSEVGRLRYLFNLDLGGNRFSSSIPGELGALSYLQSLYLGNNKLTGTIPSSLGRLTNLGGTFDLSDNLLNGTIPTNLGQLSMLLTVLNLSSNELSGTIPTELEGLVKLGHLQLQDNLLTGSIPTSFGKLSHLQILQLQSNNLIGDVPVSVCDALVENNSIVPTSMLTDCTYKVNCKCCQYCCAEGIGCECQFANTDQDFLCRYGDTLGPGARLVHLPQ